MVWISQLVEKIIIQSKVQNEKTKTKYINAIDFRKFSTTWDIDEN